MTTSGHAIPETELAARLDLVEGALLCGDPGAAAAGLDSAERLFHGDLVFGWRQRLKARLLRARLAYATGAFDESAALASSLAADAGQLGVPRYALPARLLGARACAAQGAPVDLDVVADDLAAVPHTVALEAWWLTAEAARDLHVHAGRSLAEQHAATLTAHAGPDGERATRTLRARLAALLGGTSVSVPGS